MSTPQPTDFSVHRVVRQTGMHRRFFWRVRARFGADWSRMSDAQVAREMRMVSNRRAH